MKTRPREAVGAPTIRPRFGGRGGGRGLRLLREAGSAGRLRRRVARRRLLAAAAMGAAGLAVGAACGGGEEGAGPGGRPVRQLKYGGRYQVATDVSIDTLDPHLSMVGGVAWLPSIYNVLVKQSALKPDSIFYDLAEEYEVPEPGGVEWIFRIRPDVKAPANDLGIPWRALDADDARVSFERIKALPESNACAFVSQWFETHQLEDRQTYVVKTPKPYAWFLTNIGAYTATIPPREVIDRGDSFMRQNAVGGGPFYAAVFTEGQGLNLDRNPHYYRRDQDNSDAQLPYLDGWDVSFVPDRAARLAAFTSQQSYSYRPQSQEEVNSLLAQYDVYRGAQDPVNSFISFAMNIERPPWDNSNVRKAAMHAINRQDYIDRVYGGEAQANGLVHWPTGGYALPEEELEELQGHDPELSKQLIGQAGLELPLKIKVAFPMSTIEEHDQHLPIFLEQMAAAGFQVEQDPQDFATWLDASYRPKNYDASLSLNRVYETPEAPLDFHHSKGPAGNETYSNGLQNPGIDAAIEATKEITDPDELVEAIHDVQRQIYAAGPVFLPIVSPFSRTLHWSFVKDAPTELGCAGLLRRPYRWLDLPG